MVINIVRMPPIERSSSWLEVDEEIELYLYKFCSLMEQLQYAEFDDLLSRLKYACKTYELFQCMHDNGGYTKQIVKMIAMRFEHALFKLTNLARTTLTQSLDYGPYRMHSAFALGGDHTCIANALSEWCRANYPNYYTSCVMDGAGFFVQ